jgi:hypothetical protein
MRKKFASLGFLFFGITTVAFAQDIVSVNAAFFFSGAYP